MHLTSGTKLGPYEILSPLGAGGMGEVYRARDTRLGRDVAIKVLPRHLSSDADVRTRFEREAKTISSLNHPHICTLFDVGREGETDYLVMELIEGETLASRLVKGALPVSEALRIGVQVADALDRAHRAGVVHRDLKPGNVMLTKSGAKLMDFGLARVAGLAGATGLSTGVTVAGLTQSPTAAQPLTRSIGFFATLKLRRLDLATGSVITLFEGTNSARGGTWSNAGVILFNTNYSSPLYRIPEAGGAAEAVTVIDTTVATTHRFPQFLPDGKHFIYLSASHFDADGSSSAIYWGSLDGGEPKHVLASKSSAVYANGFLLFVRDSTLMAQEFDPASGATRGEPHATREVVQLDRSTWNAPVTASTNGVLVYALSGRAGNNYVGLYDRSGRRIRNLTPVGNILSVNATPDGRHVVFEWQHRPLADIWTVDVTTGTRSRLTTSPDDENSPVWMPDGRNIVYTGRHQNRYSIYMLRADGSSAQKVIVAPTDKDTWPLDVSRDGQWLLYGVGVVSGNKAHGALWMKPLVGSGAPQLLIPEPDDFFGAQFSPDGKWIAFDVSVSGRPEVYVSPRPAPGEGLSARWQVSTAGGQRPRWRGDARELFYTRPDGMVMAASVDGSGSEFHISVEVPLFPAFQRHDVQTMDVTADGQSFIINTLGGDEAEPLAVVSNWMQTILTR